jgi:ABC-type glycerol-3-phosphate transport system substrate-binding protein
MVQEGLTFGSTFTDPKQSHVVGKVGSAVLPSGPAGHFVPYAVGAWSVADNSKHKDAGWLFVQWATSLSTLKSAVLGGQAFATPTVSSIYKTSEYKKKYGFDHFSEVSASTLDLANGTGHVSPLRGDSSYEPSSGRWTAIGTRVSQKLNLAVTGQASPQRAVAEAAKAMNG